MKIFFAHFGCICGTAFLLLGTACGRAQGQCVPPPEMKALELTANGNGTLGNWFSAHGQNGCAMEAYRRGLALQPLSAPLHYSMGMALVAAHQEAPAVAELEAALKADPGFDRAYLVLGVLAHNRGDRDSALRYWQEALRLNPQSTVTLDWIAKTRIESGQYTAAADLVRTAPESEDLALDLLMADSKAKLYEEAISYGQRMLASHADWKRLRVALATVMVQRNRFEDGLQLLDAALRDEPQSLDLQLLRLRVLVLMNDTTRARPLADQLLAAHPQDFDLLYLSGLLRREDGDYAGALPLLEAAKAQRPEHFDVRFNLGIALAKMHRLPEARAELAKAASLPGSSPDVHFQLAGVERSQGETAAAGEEMKLYQQRLASQASHDELVSLSAQASQKLRTGDAAGAAALERQILSKYPDDAVHWYDLALALDAAQDLPLELDALQHAVHLRPDFAVALNQLGFLQARAGKKAEAEASLRAAVAAAPQYAEAQNNLGSLLSEAGRDAEAETCFRSATAANPRAVDAWINLAATLAARGQYGEARGAVKSALLVQPGNQDAERLSAMLAEAPVAPGPAAKP